MFAKVMDKEDKCRYVMNVKGIDSGAKRYYDIDSLLSQGCLGVQPEELDETYGRMLTIERFGDEDDVIIFCNNVVYLCNETGQTVDRIQCKDI